MKWLIWAAALSLVFVTGVALGSGRSVTATIKDYFLWFGIALVVSGFATYVLLKLLGKA